MFSRKALSNYYNKVINNCHVFFGIVMSVVAEIQHLWFVLPRVWYCTMKWSKCLKLTDRFVKQSPHTLYLTWKSWTIEVFTLQKKLRELFTCVLSWLPFAVTEWISIKATKWCCNKKLTNTTNFFQVNTCKEFHAPSWGFLASCGEDFWLLSFQSSCG